MVPAEVEETLPGLERIRGDTLRKFALSRL
jgi:hypothetical protein